jgi:hypothetical protein
LGFGGETVTGIAHLSTGLLLKAKFKRVPLLWLMLAAEAADLIWVALNLLHPAGEEPLEYSYVAPGASSFADMQFVQQPISHSLVATAALAAYLGVLAYIALREHGAAVAIFLATFGHWLLDYLVHDADLPLHPLPGSPLLGPALNMDAAAPLRGLNATMPVAGWLVQTAIALLCTRAFLDAYPVDRIKKRWFYTVMVVLCALPGSLFVDSIASPVGGATSLVLATLGEIILTATILWVFVSRFSHPWLREAAPAYSEALVSRLRGLKQVAGALCYTLAATYLLQSMLDAGEAPAVGRYALAFAAMYLALGHGLSGWNLGDLWYGVTMPLLFAPLARALWGPGSTGLLNLGLELLLATTAVYTIVKLKTNRVML